MRTNILTGTWNGTGAALYLCLGAIPKEIEMWDIEAGTNPNAILWREEFIQAATTYGGLYMTGSSGAYTKLTTAGVFPYEGGELLMSDADIEKFYSATSGYILGQPDTDRGAYMTDVLAYWAKTGVAVGDRTHKLDGYFKLPFDSAAIAQAIQMCGPIAIGVSLTKGDMDNQVWGQPQPGEDTSTEVIAVILPWCRRNSVE